MSDHFATVHWQRGEQSHSRLAHPAPSGHSGAPADDVSEVDDDDGDSDDGDEGRGETSARAASAAVALNKTREV